MQDQDPEDEIKTADYDAIQAAVMQTARGRWFLAEYARRNRVTDTEAVLTAIGHLSERVTDQQALAGQARLSAQISAMAEMIARTRAEIAALRHVGTDDPRAGIAQIVSGMERATAQIMQAAERIREVAIPMTSEGLGSRTTEIRLSQVIQDDVVQSTGLVIHTRHDIEPRRGADDEIAPQEVIEAVAVPALAPAAALWTERAAEAAAIPASVVRLADERLRRDAVRDEEPVNDWGRRTQPSLSERMRAFAAIEALDTRQKLRLFA